MPANLLPAVLGVANSLVDRIFPDKVKQASERAQAELALAQLLQEGRLKELEHSMSAIIAEAQSSDPWTSRARPSFLYVIYLMILMSVPMGFLAAFEPDMAERVAGGMKAWLAAIPEPLYALFGVGYLGYAGLRTYDKKINSTH
jgi:hypothetical protein